MDLDLCFGSTNEEISGGKMIDLEDLTDGDLIVKAIVGGGL